MNATLTKSKPKPKAKFKPKTQRKYTKEISAYWFMWQEIFDKFGITDKAEQSLWRKELKAEVLGSDRPQSTFNHMSCNTLAPLMHKLSYAIQHPQNVLFPNPATHLRRLCNYKKAKGIRKDKNKPQIPKTLPQTAFYREFPKNPSVYPTISHNFPQYPITQTSCTNSLGEKKTN